MSTKTTFKRIALVAVAALGLGVLSVAPSSAAPTVTTTTAYDTTTTTGIIGGQVTLTLQTDTSTTSTRSTVVVSGVGSVVSAVSAAGADSSTVAGTPTSGTFYIDNTEARPAKTIVVLTSSVAGSTVVTVTPLNASGTPGTAVTKTVTWTTADTLGASAAKSTSYINAYTAGAGAAFTADASITVPKGTTPAQAAAIKVTLKDANGIAVNGKTVTASVSGPGLIVLKEADETVTATSGVRAASLAVTGNVFYVGVLNDGSAGVGTITVSVGSTVISTETITFSGSASKYTVTALSGAYAIAANGGSDSATATGLSVLVTDSAGLAVPSATVYFKSSDTTIATVDASATTSALTTGPTGYAYATVTGVKSGSTTITVCDTSACTSPTISAPVTIKVTKTQAATVTASFAKATYVPGEKMTLNIVATDADGNPVADQNAGTYVMTGNLASTSTLPTAAAFVGGTHTVSIYAPVSSGTYAVTIKLVKGSAWATALGDTTITASTVVANPGADAATDAANEATDAANAATDAALAAADAADAATAAAQDASDAVAALSATVAKLVASLKAQITSLTNLVIKIQKKVKA